jgi:hypothetical protein
MTLSERQSTLASALSASHASWPPELLGEIAPGGTLDAAGALAVYRSGYFARLTEQLGETYETVWRVLGDAAFFAACEQYIAAHPSTSYNLSDYGRDFPAHLDAMPERPAPFVSQLLAELARFELTFHDLFHAPGHAAAGGQTIAESLANLGDLTGVRLRFGSAVRLVACRWAVFDLFRHRKETEAPEIDVERPQWLVLFKQDGDVHTHELDRATFVALSALVDGMTVDEALDRAAVEAGGDGLAPADVARLFERIVVSGIVTGWDR